MKPAISERAPAVSVVLPVKAGDPEHLAAAVHSVLTGTLADLELIVIEDPASTGVVAAAALAAIDDPRLRLICNPTPTSLVAQLNQGLAAARAELVARMDADDLCEPTRLEVQRGLLMADPGLAVVGAQVLIIDERGEVIGRRRYPTEHVDIVAAMTRYNPFAHPAVMFRKELVVEAGGYRYPERPAQDYELWCRLAVAGHRFANSPEALLRYRVHALSVKSTLLRETLRSTLQTKREHWTGRMSQRARLRMAAEHLVLLLPPRLVLGLFRRLEYRAVTPDDPGAVRHELGQGLGLLASHAIAAMLTMGYLAWVGRALGTEAAADFFSGVFTIFLLVSVFGPINVVVTHLTAVDAARGAHEHAHRLRRWMGRRVAVGGAALGAIALVSSAPGTTSSVRVWAFLVAWIWILLSVGRGHLRGVKRFGAYGASVLFESVVRLALGAVVLLTAPSPDRALWPYFAAAALAWVVVEGSLRGPVGRDPVDGAAVARLAAPMFVLALADAGYQNWDVLFVKWHHEPTAAGIYGAAAAVTRALGVLLTPFVTLAMPLLTERHERRQGTGAALLRLCGYFVALSALPLAAFGWWDDELIRLLYGPEFAAAAPLLLPHALQLLLAYLAMMIGQAFAAARRFDFLLLYLAGFVAQVALMPTDGGSPRALIDTLLAVRVAVLSAMVALWLLWPTAPRARSAV